ncbi:hypothetical protein PUN28_002542 [Cardiocondyla obscurior]|uniref:Uncharacterized protein n=1 Tax=Cardiocondyla obscurior TaxID=286306 RepID=A0AAW2GUQ4_9HYME
MRAREKIQYLISIYLLCSANTRYLRREACLRYRAGATACRGSEYIINTFIAAPVINSRARALLISNDREVLYSVRTSGSILDVPIIIRLVSLPEREEIFLRQRVQLRSIFISSNISNFIHRVYASILSRMTNYERQLRSQLPCGTAAVLFLVANYIDIILYPGANCKSIKS